MRPALKRDLLLAEAMAGELRKQRWRISRYKSTLMQ